MAKKVLTLDDGETVRQLISITLESVGFEVIEAENGIEGLRQIEKNPDIAFILCDLNMPEMSGMEFLEELNRQNIKIPTMMLTTEVKRDAVKRGKALGLKGWIVKPFDPPALKEIVTKLAL